jgi:UDP:flavonoid glycosyltransferase YjiC (YdhE family)
MIARPRYNAMTATRELAALLKQPHYAVKAAEVGRVVQNEDGACAAADAIEEILR